MREIWVSDGSVRLFVVEEGDGFPLLFLHGGLADHRAVRPIVGSLTDSLRVITPDQRGSGRSWSSGPLTFDLLADDLVRVLDDLDLDQCVVGGVSSGSGTALRFALRHPDRTRGLVVVHPVYAGSEVGFTEEQTAAFGAMDAVASRALEEGIEVLRPLYFGHLPETIAERAWTLASEFDPASVVATSRFVASGEQPFHAAQDLRRLDSPALLIRGNDPQHPPGVSDLYESAMPNCTSLSAESEPGPAIRAFCRGIDDG